MTNEQIAENAIALLRLGIDEESRNKCLVAYDMVEDSDFSWDNLDVLFMEWDDLVDEANNIICGE